MKHLINSKKIILSPHVAGWTVESSIKIAKTRINLTFNKYDGINFVFKDIENNDNFVVIN